MSSDIGIETLTDLALNLRWSWNRSTDELWAQLDPELWAATQGTRYQISVELYLGQRDPEAVRVDLYAEAIDGQEPERHAMARGRKVEGPGNGYEYQVSIPVGRVIGDYSPRVLPYHPAAAVPLEAPENPLAAMNGTLAGRRPNSPVNWRLGDGPHSRA
jgi:hypothetical protein